MKRIIALGAVWTASAAAAVGLGFLAVSLVDASASPGTTLAAATTGPSTSSSTSSGASPSTTTSTPTVAPAGPSATGEYATAGGTVFADCASGSPVLAGVPAAGWYVDDSDDLGEMEFKSGDHEVEVHVVCVGGAPVFSLDDSSSSSHRSPSSSSPASATSGHDDSGRDDSGHDDDSSGRGGGGHGSDDGPGDDSSGRGSGGHGSDD